MACTERLALSVAEVSRSEPLAKPLRKEKCGWCNCPELPTVTVLDEMEIAIELSGTMTKTL